MTPRLCKEQKGELFALNPYGPAVDKLHFLARTFWFGSCAYWELPHWKSKCLVRGALPSNVLVSEAFVLLQSS